MARAIVNNIGPTKVATLRHVEVSGGTTGTTSTAAYTARILNTVEGDTSFVTLTNGTTGTGGTNNRFSLIAGKYLIEGEEQAWKVYNSKIKLVDYTNTADAIIGTNVYTHNADYCSSIVTLVGIIEIFSTTEYELKGRSTSAVAGGIGKAANFGEIEIYQSLKITKL